MVCITQFSVTIPARKSQEFGFIKAYNLEGSIFKWDNEGRTLVRKQTTVHKVHPYNNHWGKLLEEKYHFDAE